MKKNILFIIPSLIGGGAEKTVANLSVHMQKEYNIIIVAFKDTGKKYTYGGEFIPLSNNANKNILQKTILFFRAINKIRKIKKTRNIDYSISFLTPADFFNILTKTKRSKTIISIRNTDSILNRRIMRILTKITCKHCDRVVSISRQVKDDLITSFHVNPEKIDVIYNPSLLIDFSNQSKKTSTEQFKNCFTFINVGRLADQKGQWHLIRAFKLVADKHENARLLLLGEGPLHEYYNELISTYNLEDKVKLLGFVDNPYDYIRNANVFVFSSLFEGLGNSLIEALGCGIPIISTDCISGPREILAPNTNYRNKTRDIDYAEYGILVPVFDGSKKYGHEAFSKEEIILSKAMSSLVKNSQLLKKYAKKSKERSKHYNIDRIINEWKNTMDKADKAHER